MDGVGQQSPLTDINHNVSVFLLVTVAVNCTCHHKFLIPPKSALNEQPDRSTSVTMKRY